MCLHRYRHFRKSGVMQASRYTFSLEDSLDGGRDQIETSGTCTERDHRIERGQSSLYREHVSQICFLLSPNLQPSCNIVGCERSMKGIVRSKARKYAMYGMIKKVASLSVNCISEKESVTKKLRK